MHALRGLGCRVGLEGRSVVVDSCGPWPSRPHTHTQSHQQDFKKPFDATAILIVGQQTGGKSALIEALMGFQFNQVGGGTKTRRPIALRMQYNPRCSQPHCFLTLDNGKEEPRSLKEIQAYIEAENKRLENDELRCFDPREIMVRVEVSHSVG